MKLELEYKQIKTIYKALQSLLNTEYNNYKNESDKVCKIAESEYINHLCDIMQSLKDQCNE